MFNLSRMVKKHWEADIKGYIIVAPTLKQLAQKLDIKPSLIEGVYYRSRLEHKIKIRKVVEESVKPLPLTKQPNSLGLFEVCFD